MSFNRPTLSEIIARIESDIETRLATGKLLTRSLLSILARAYAGAVHLLYGYISYGIKQIFPDTADDENMTRHASFWGIPRNAASYASGNVNFSGVDGSIIPQGIRLKRADGIFYLTTSSATIVSGVATVSVQAVNAGTLGNAPAASSLSLVNSEVGLNTSATVASGGIVNGLDSEANPSLLARLLDRIRQPPHGGAEFDYIKWAKEVIGVTRAWAYSNHLGAGTVGVTFVMDGETDIIPNGTKVTEVQNYIDAPYRRPATADVTVFAPVADALNFTIHISPDTADVRASVQESLKDLVRRLGEPGGTIQLSKIRESVSVAAGENDNSVTVPSANVVSAAGHIPIFGTITWT